MAVRPTRLILAMTLLIPLFPDRASADDLPRQGLFGAAITPVPDDVRREQKLEAGTGVSVRAVIPNSAAEEAGLKAGDIITAVDETRIDGPARYVAGLGRRKEGEKTEVAIARGGKEQSLRMTLKPRPREKGSDDFDVLYESASSRGGRLRMILTRPKTSGRHPAMYLIQGLGGFSVEDAPGNPKLYGRIIDDFARRGFVTLRVEKPGQGDSEGGPTQDVDFETELDGYRQALKALKAFDFVDAESIVIFGHSMGGIMGPLIAAESPVKGIAAFGTASKTWYEYLLENTRRQMALGGSSAADIDEALRKDAAINFLVFVQGQTPGEIAKAHPGLKSRVDEMFTEGLAVSPDGRKVWAGRRSGGDIAVIDAATLAVKSTVHTGATMAARLRFTPDGKRVLLPDPAGGRLIVLDAASHKEIKSINVGEGPVGALPDPSGRRAYVPLAGAGQVAVVDLESLSLAGTIETGSVSDGMAWVPARVAASTPK